LIAITHGSTPARRVIPLPSLVKHDFKFTLYERVKAAGWFIEKEDLRRMHECLYNLLSITFGEIMNVIIKIEIKSFCELIEDMN
jgi:hypothetical protein